MEFLTLITFEFLCKKDAFEFTKCILKNSLEEEVENVLLLKTFLHGYCCLLFNWLEILLCKVSNPNVHGNATEVFYC